MKKRIAGILALTLAFATLLGGCGSKMTADDAKSYAQACLDASYKGEFDEYLSQTDSTKEEAQEMYDNGINLTMEASDIENSGVSQELQDKYRQMFIDLYKSADYTLDNAKEDGEDGFTVDVTVKPFLIFEGLDDELNTKLEEIAANMTEVPSDEEINEMVYQAMYDIISPKLSNMEYGDPVTVTIHVVPDDDGVYYVPDDDYQAVENALLPE